MRVSLFHVQIKPDFCSTITFQKEYKDKSLHKEYIVAKALRDQSCPDCEIARASDQWSHKKHRYPYQAKLEGLTSRNPELTILNHDHGLDSSDESDDD